MFQSVPRTRKDISLDLYDIDSCSSAIEVSYKIIHFDNSDKHCDAVHFK